MDIRTMLKSNATFLIDKLPPTVYKRYDKLTTTRELHYHRLTYKTLFYLT